MLKAIRHGLGNLLNSEGRDGRQAFWYYVLFVYVLLTVLSLVVIVPLMLQAVFAGIEQGVAASRSGDPLTAQSVAEAAVFGSMNQVMSIMVWMGIGTGALMILLLATALVRRLHDSDVSGYWALVPGAIYLMNLILMPSLMRGMMDEMRQVAPGDPMAGVAAMQTSFTLASLLGWLAIIVVIVLGVRRSTPGPNRFGDASFTA